MSDRERASLKRQHHHLHQSGESDEEAEVPPQRFRHGNVNPTWTYPIQPPSMANKDQPMHDYHSQLLDVNNNDDIEMSPVQQPVVVRHENQLENYGYQRQHMVEHYRRQGPVMMSPLTFMPPMGFFQQWRPRSSNEWPMMANVPPLYLRLRTMIAPEAHAYASPPPSDPRAARMQEWVNSMGAQAMQMQKQAEANRTEALEETGR